MTSAEAQTLTRAVAAWMRDVPDLRALAPAGSWARGDARADSDLDLLILAEQPAQYRSSQQWLHQIVLPEPFRVISARGAVYGVVWSCHVALDPAAELELGFGALNWAATDPIDAGSRGVIQGGFRIVVDKDGLLQRIVEAVENPNCSLL